MYFRTETHEYRSKGAGWQERTLGASNWKDVAKNLWKSIYALRKSVMGNRRPSIAESARIRLDQRYNEHTKKTTSWAYKYGVPLDQIITD